MKSLAYNIPLLICAFALVILIAFLLSLKDNKKREEIKKQREKKILEQEQQNVLKLDNGLKKNKKIVMSKIPYKPIKEEKAQNNTTKTLSPKAIEKINKSILDKILKPNNIIENVAQNIDNNSEEKQDKPIIKQLYKPEEKQVKINEVNKKNENKEEENKEGDIEIEEVEEKDLDKQQYDIHNTKKTKFFALLYDQITALEQPKENKTNFVIDNKVINQHQQIASFSFVRFNSDEGNASDHEDKKKYYNNFLCDRYKISGCHYTYTTEKLFQQYSQQLKQDCHLNNEDIENFNNHSMNDNDKVKNIVTKIHEYDFEEYKEKIDSFFNDVENNKNNIKMLKFVLDIHGTENGEIILDPSILTYFFEKVVQFKLTHLPIQIINTACYAAEKMVLDYNKTIIIDCKTTITDLVKQYVRSNNLKVLLELHDNKETKHITKTSHCKKGDNEYTMRSVSFGHFKDNFYTFNENSKKIRKKIYNFNFGYNVARYDLHKLAGIDNQDVVKV